MPNPSQQAQIEWMGGTDYRVNFAGLTFASYSSKAGAITVVSKINDAIDAALAEQREQIEKDVQMAVQRTTTDIGHFETHDAVMRAVLTAIRRGVTLNQSPQPPHGSTPSPEKCKKCWDGFFYGACARGDCKPMLHEGECPRCRHCSPSGGPAGLPSGGEGEVDG